MAATANASAHCHGHGRKGNHARPLRQARLKPDTFFADGSRIRLIEPMTPEREATLAWCKVAGLGGAWRGLAGLGGTWGAAENLGDAGCRAAPQLDQLVAASPQERLGACGVRVTQPAVYCHSQPAAFCHSGCSGGGGAPQPRAPPCAPHGGQPVGATASVCPSVHMPVGSRV